MSLLSQKLKDRIKPRSNNGSTTTASRNRHSKNPSGPTTSEDDDFDLDRLLPQPLDDAAIKHKAQNLFSQIGAHVDSFYIDTPVDVASVPAESDAPVTQILLDPVKRLFMIKKVICQTVLEAIGPDCPSDGSLLPYGFTSVARRLREPNVNDQVNTLLWSRFRTSFAFLLRSDSTSDQTRLDQAISIIVERLNRQLQPFEVPGSTEHRLQDLDAICRASSGIGQTFLSQPAVWKFEWDIEVATRSASASSTPGLIYFPQLTRLTDNKAKKLEPSRIVLQAKTMQ